MKKDANTHLAEMTRDLMSRIGDKKVDAGDIPAIAHDIMRKKRIQLKPEIAGHSADGQMMLDQFGRKALVLPDGTVKEVA